MRAGIAGAGIMGQLLAFSLHQAGWEVSLFDENNAASPYNCSMTAAGLLTPIAELEKSDAIIFELGTAALKSHWPMLLNQLQMSVDFQQAGSLILAHPRDKLELEQYIQLINSKLNNKSLCTALNQTQISAIEPEITKFHEGYFFHDEGYIDNQTLLQSLKSYLQSQSGIIANDAPFAALPNTHSAVIPSRARDLNAAAKFQWHANSFVQSIEPFKITVNNQTHRFDFVFDCRGLGAKSSFANLRSLRGELIWLHAPEVNITRPIRFLHPRYGLYIVPRPQRKYIVGASEIESEDRSTISVRTTLELLTAAYYVHSGFAEARVLNTLTHCRPTLADHLPKIKYSEGFIAVNGLYRHGILIAPSLMADIMCYLQSGITSIHYPQLWEKHLDYCTLG
jgi:glycine oxidase